MFRLKLCCLLCISCLGCTSMRSTMINRHEDESYTGSSNGKPKWFNMARPYRGVPITIKVPTHLDVTITETSYLYDTATGLRELKLTTPHRDVDIKTIETDKVFVVDFKRPISGSLKYSAEFGSDQYFDKIAGELEDTTITDVANLVATVAPLFANKSSGTLNSKAGLGAELITNQRVVAFKRFDIDACDVEQQIKDFLDLHLNCGHSCDDQTIVHPSGSVGEVLPIVNEVKITPPKSAMMPTPGEAEPQ